MKAPSALHKAVRQNDLVQVAHLLSTGQENIDVFERRLTPLMVAVSRDSIGIEMVELLLASGAGKELTSRKGQYVGGESVLQLAIRNGDIAKVQVLAGAGVSLHYRDEDGFDALIDAACGDHENRQIDVMRWLIGQGGPLNGIDCHGRTALHVAAGSEQWKIVQFLLDQGFDRAKLKWTPLLQAVVLGSLEDVREALATQPALEARDFRDMTAWLRAVSMGDLPKAKLLYEAGAQVGALTHVEDTALRLAAKKGYAAMLRWLLQIGMPADQPGQGARTPLFDCPNLPCVRILVQAGAGVNHEIEYGQTPLTQVTESVRIAQYLLEAGADPAKLTREIRRKMLGMPGEPGKGPLKGVTQEQFTRGRGARRGSRNPELIDEPFWTAMVRAGVPAYAGNRAFKGPTSYSEGDFTRVWCAHRFGQSLTFLPDGRAIQIGGEHEDFYDPDFYIYNDVFVHSPDGGLEIYGYPETAFPPTDFHTATLVENFIYVIGSLGYMGSRQFGTTPVYRLDLATMAFGSVPCTGPAPGWIYSHRAILLSPTEIRIWGGNVQQAEKVYVENKRAFILDVSHAEWRECPES